MILFSKYVSIRYVHIGGHYWSTSSKHNPHDLIIYRHYCRGSDVTLCCLNTNKNKLECMNGLVSAAVRRAINWTFNSPHYSGAFILCL